MNTDQKEETNYAP